jgi:aminoglycoside phosphotransferase family enzyme/predicted kinase
MGLFWKLGLSGFKEMWPRHNTPNIATYGADQNQPSSCDQFLGSPAAYDFAPEHVDRIETHASVVFLAGGHAYKVKRAVKYPFLDFSTLERRRSALLNELRLNLRTAPQLYLEVVPVTQGDDGKFHLGGKGDAMEWVLVMRRFDQARLYDRMAEEGRLQLSDMPQLAQVIAAFHRGANRNLAPQPPVEALRAVIEDNATTLATREDGLTGEILAEVNRLSREALAGLSLLLQARALGGYVRHCHGDLHLRNIVEIGGAPTLFDAVEFDDAIATIDVLYDLAFLLMDLGARKLPAHANAVLNAYLEAGGDTANLLGLAALPLFLAMRAMIRAKVELLRAGLSSDSRTEARARVASYALLARDYLSARPRPQLIAIGGLSGSGKSSVAHALAPHLGAFPGAVHVRSDVERKRMFGVDAGERLPRSAYAAEVSDIVYGICRKRALMALEGGAAVIVDAVHAKEDERDAIAEIAARAGAMFTGLWLDAPADAMRERIAGRTGDVSDATPDVLDEQLGFDLGAQTFAVVDAGRPLDQVVASCLALTRPPNG